MLSRSVGLLVTCALAAQAFLVPPGVDFSASDDNDVGKSELVSLSTHYLLELPCSSCAFPVKPEDRIDESQVDEDELFWIQGGANKLILNFTTSEDKRSLLLNEKEIFPGLSRENFEGWYVKQVPGHASLDEVQSGKIGGTELEVTGFGVGLLEQENFPDGSSRFVLGVRILSLEEQDMSIGEIHVGLFKLESEELLIMEVVPPELFPTDFENLLPPPPRPADDSFVDHELPPFRPAHGPPFGPSHGDQEECGVLPGPLCRLKHHWGSKGWGRPGCNGRKGGPPQRLPGHIKGPVFPVGDSPPGPPFEHGHHHHNPHHGPDAPWERPAEHNFVVGLLEGFITVLIPVMAGVAVGMTVSLVGLLAGRFISWAWIKFARGGRRGYASLAQTDSEHTDDSKIAPAHADAPPSYEPAPAYQPQEQETTEQDFQPTLNDALSFLDQVKARFASHPGVYDEFLEIMSASKSGTLDASGIVGRVSTLLADYPDLV